MTLKSKDDFAKGAKEEWTFAHQCDRIAGSTTNPAEYRRMANAARDRAIEDEKCRDSWWYRMFGW